MHDIQNKLPSPPPILGRAPRSEGRADLPSVGVPARDSGRHAQGPVSFLPPAAWREVTVFTAPVAAGARVVPSISVTREPLPPGYTLHTHVDRLLGKVRDAVPGFELLQTRTVSVGGRMAVLARFAMDGAQDRIEQAMVAVDPAEDTERLVTTFHASGPRSLSVRMMEQLVALLETVRFAAPRAPIPARADPYPDLTPSIPMPGYRANR